MVSVGYGHSLKYVLRDGADVDMFWPAQALLTRVVQRPQSSVDALKRACSELGTGVVSGVTGILVDPLQVSAPSVALSQGQLSVSLATAPFRPE